jgi:hypothetical protein
LVSDGTVEWHQAARHRESRVRRTHGLLTKAIAAAPSAFASR